eukprot:91232_1
MTARPRDRSQTITLGTTPQRAIGRWAKPLQPGKKSTPGNTMNQRTYLNVVNWNMKNLGDTTVHNVHYRAKMQIILELANGYFGAVRIGLFDVFVLEEVDPTLPRDPTHVNTFTKLQTKFGDGYEHYINMPRRRDLRVDRHSVAMFIRKESMVIREQVDVVAECPRLHTPQKLVVVLVCLRDDTTALIFGTHLKKDERNPNGSNKSYQRRREEVVVCIDAIRVKYAGLYGEDIATIVVGDMNTDQTLPFRVGRGLPEMKNIKVKFPGDSRIGNKAIDQLYANGDIYQFNKGSRTNRKSISDHTIVMAQVTFKKNRPNSGQMCRPPRPPQRTAPHGTHLPPIQHTGATTHTPFLPPPHTGPVTGTHGTHTPFLPPPHTGPVTGTHGTHTPFLPPPHTGPVTGTHGTHTPFLPPPQQQITPPEHTATHGTQQQKAIQEIYGDYYDAQITYPNDIGTFAGFQFQPLIGAYDGQGGQLFVFCILLFVLCGLATVVCGACGCLLWFVGCEHVDSTFYAVYQYIYKVLIHKEQREMEYEAVITQPQVVVAQQ